MIGWAIILILIALVIFVAELFIPSGGLLGLFGVSFLVGGIVCLFWWNQTIGIVVAILVLLASPFFIALALKIFPKTPIARMMTLHGTQDPTKVIYDQARDENPQALVGLKGVAVSSLRPVGTCKIDGNRLECLAESGMIHSGTSVEIISVNGIEIKVRAV